MLVRRREACRRRDNAASDQRHNPTLDRPSATNRFRLDVNGLLRKRPSPRSVGNIPQLSPFSLRA